MGVIDMVNGRLCETLPIEEIEQIRNEAYNKALEDLWNTLVKYQRAIENANYPFNFIQIAFDEVRERLK